MIHLENIKIKCIACTGIIENVYGLHVDGIDISYDKENWFDWATHGHLGLEE